MCIFVYRLLTKSSFLVDDYDCAGDLRCVKRSRHDGTENVPGCSWGLNYNTFRQENDDYCFMPIKRLGQINYVGECSSSNGYLCGECEGDCDSDADCEGNLICSKRSGFEGVPGCIGENGDRDVAGKDICKTPESITNAPTVVPTAEIRLDEIRYVGNPCTNEFATGLCDQCTGDCDSDADCAGELRCVQRRKFNGVENVPGCSWAFGSDSIRNDNDDYCRLSCCAFFLCLYISTLTFLLLSFKVSNQQRKKA